MSESRLELKVGALIALAVGGALVLLWLMGDLSMSGGAPLEVDFSHTGNVVKGAPVKLGGIEVGRVKSVTLLADRRDPAGDPLPVAITLSISTEARAALKSDAAVTVSSQGALGESYLELNPGAAATPLPANQRVRGLDAPRIDVVSNRLARFLEAITRSLDENPDAVAHLVKNVTGLAQSLDGVIVDNKGDLRALLLELNAAVKDLRALAALGRAQLEPHGKANELIEDAAATAKALRADWPGLSKNAGTALGGLAQFAGPLTEDDAKRLKAALAKLDSTSERADRILARLEAGEGSVGAALKDKQLFEDLKGLLSDLKKAPWKLLWKN